jgi:hypothetical protein
VKLRAFDKVFCKIRRIWNISIFFMFCGFIEENNFLGFFGSVYELRNFDFEIIKEHVLEFHHNENETLFCVVPVA